MNHISVIIRKKIYLLLFVFLSSFEIGEEEEERKFSDIFDKINIFIKKKEENDESTSVFYKDLI